MNLLLACPLFLGQIYGPATNVYAYACGYGVQAGTPLTNVRYELTPVEEIGPVVGVATSRTHGVAVRADGTVWNWGENNKGQMGQGTRGAKAFIFPSQVRSLPKCTQVAAGNEYSLALAENGEVWGWGSNGAQSLGQPGKAGYWWLPTKVPGIQNAVQIASTANGGLALRADGTLMGWGYNGNGQLAQGSTAITSAPVVIPGIDHVAKICSYDRSVMVLKTDGTLWAWGANGLGRLGVGSTASNVTVPMQVVGLTGVSDASAGPMHSIALLNSGMVATWGFNQYGELGDPNMARGYVCRDHAQIQPELSNGTATMVSAGDGSTLVGFSDKNAEVVGKTNNLLEAWQVLVPTAVPNGDHISAAAPSAFNWMVLRATDQPIWSEFRGETIVAGHGSTLWRIHTENAAGSTTLALSTTSPIATIPPAAEIPAGSKSTEVSVTYPTSVAEPGKLQLAARAGSSQSTVLVYYDIERAWASFPQGNPQAGDPIAGYFSINFTAPSEGTVVKIVNDQPKAIDLPSQIVIPGGKKAIVLSFPTFPSTESTEVHLTLSVYDHLSDAYAYINGNALAGATLSPSPIPGGVPAKFTVHLAKSAPASGQVVNLLQGNTDYEMPSQITVPAGRRDATATLNTRHQTEDRSAPITYYVQGSYPKVVWATISAPKLIGFTLTPADFYADQSPKLTITLDAPSDGDVVALKSSRAELGVPATVTIPKGLRSAVIDVTVNPVDRPLNVTLSARRGKVALTTVATVRPVPAPLKSLTFDTTTIQGGKLATATLELDGPAPIGGAVVTLRSNQASAEVPESITVRSGAKIASFHVATKATSATTYAVITARLRGVAVSAKLKIVP